MVGRLPWNFPNDAAYDISLHHYMITRVDTLIAGYYHDDMDVLHDPMMMKKPNIPHAVPKFLCIKFKDNHKEKLFWTPWRHPLKMDPRPS